MKTRISIAMLWLASVTAGCNCDSPCNPALPEEEQPEECFDAGPPAQPDFCNKPDEAKSDTVNCVLPLACGADGGQTAYINPPTDAGINQDWYSTSFGQLSARSLLHIQAGYTAPLTPVALSVTVLKSNASESLAREVDDHGQGAPKLIDILVPYTESNSQLLILLADKGGRPVPAYDLRNPYFVSVCTQENPDVNEPNDSPDAGATQIALTTMGATLHGSNTGFLATDDDVDRFQFTVPPNMPAARNLIYLHITTPAELMPPPPYRLSYIMYDPNNVPIAEGVTQNAFLKVDLATAKLVRTPGVYTVVVQGYENNPNDPAIVPGNLRQQYTVDVTVMEDLNREEPNDTMGEAAPKVMTLSPGGSVSKTGRISYTPDPEWFAFDIPANPSGHSTMSVTFRVASASGRFAPLAGQHDYQARVMSAVPGANVPDSINNCLTDQGLCPKGYDPQDTVQRDLVTKICVGFADAGSAECLWMERNANLDAKHFQDLHNMDAVIPVPPRNQTTRYWVVVGDDGNNWADDVTWTLNVSLAADPDEARFSGGPLASTLNGTISGQLTHGFGRVLEDWDLNECARNPNGNGGNGNNCFGVRSPFDYDAVPTDTDTFTFTLPGGMDENWGLQWEIDKADGGNVPAELGIDLSFCGTVLSDGGCGIRTTTAYQTGTFSPWYSDQDPDRVVGWSRQDMGSFVRITAQANQCLCLQRAFTKFNMSVVVADRNYYAPLTYRVTQTAGAYTGMFPGDSGVPTPCGTVAADAGATVPACGLP